jgi:hypothetical protein
VDQDIWQKPVYLERYGRPGVITIFDTQDAARLLFKHYRLRKTAAVETALLTCQNRIIGQATSEMARYEFIEAAVSAGYHILPDTFMGDGFRSRPHPPVSPRTAGRPDAHPDAGPQSGKPSSAEDLLNELLRVGGDLFRLLVDRTAASVVNALKI